MVGGLYVRRTTAGQFTHTRTPTCRSAGAALSYRPAAHAAGRRKTWRGVRMAPSPRHSTTASFPYVAVTALSLPGAAMMTLAGGALFGLGWGLLIVSFASSIGATLAFLVSRHLLRDSVQGALRRSAWPRSTAASRATARSTCSPLRLVPAFPFFLINLLMGLTKMKARTFYWVSQLGMLAGTLVYVNAGTQLGAVDSAWPASCRRACSAPSCCSACSRCWREGGRARAGAQGLCAVDAARSASTATWS
jgi:membrane protein DedA with SNARE-associated domain